VTGPVPNRQTIETAIGSFLTLILPPGTPISIGQENRVPEPAAQDFVIFTFMFQRRLATNENGYDDVQFTGSVAGDVLTVSSVKFGTILVGSTLFGPTVASFTLIQPGGTGIGGVGTYVLSQAQTVASGTLAAGVEMLTQETELSYQIDVHGPNSADNAQVISTLWRDERGVDFFTRNYSDIEPLYADDPRQTPFQNDQAQIEYRWTIDAKLQANQTVTLPQQFADQLFVHVIPLT
jgi:hypothetical protein